VQRVQVARFSLDFLLVALQLRLRFAIREARFHGENIV
jgi:hypothetical protein